MCPLESSQKRFCLFCARLSNEGHIVMIVSHQGELSSGERGPDIRPPVPQTSDKHRSRERETANYIYIECNNLNFSF